MTELIEIRVGQIWHARDHYGGTRRHRVVGVDPDVNDPEITHGPKVEMVNLDTGRLTTPMARTVRGSYRLEQDTDA